MTVSEDGCKKVTHVWKTIRNHPYTVHRWSPIAEEFLSVGGKRDKQHLGAETIEDRGETYENLMN